MSGGTDSSPVKGSFLTSTRTKFIALVGALVIASLLGGGLVALWNVNKLSHDASAEIESGLTKANEEYLTRYIDMTAQRATLMFNRTFDQVTALARLSQDLIDHPELNQDLGQFLERYPDFRDELTYNRDANWLQNASGEPSVISVWGYLLDAAGNMRPDVVDAVRNTQFFDLVVPSLMASGQDKLQMYYVGPKERPIMRTMPYSEQAQTFDKLYPGNNQQNWWDFFFPGVYEAWQGWLKDPASRPVPTDITVLAPYVDAITGKLIVSYFHPLYTKSRDAIAGMVAMDVTLDQLTKLVEDVKIAQTGFAFLSQQNGNVLTVTKEGEALLGLTEVAATGSGVTGHERSLFKSSFKDVANLRIPRQGATTIDHVTVEKDGKPVGIQQFIGRRPIAAFGNSDGDKAMLEYVTIGNPHPSFGMIVRHTDAAREYQYDVNPKSSGTLVDALKEAPARGWTVVDMAADWRTVFADTVPGEKADVRVTERQ